MCTKAKQRGLAIVALTILALSIGATPSTTADSMIDPVVGTVPTETVMTSAASGSSVSGSAVSGSAIVGSIVAKPSVEIKKVSYRRYLKRTVKIRKLPKKKSKAIKKLEMATKVKVIGEVKKSKWVAIKYKKNKTAYIHEKHLAKKKPYIWTGKKLTRSAGVNSGPSGKETYYNLPMGGVLRYMRARGNHDKYWVRNDGVKMLGKYIMVAANIHLRPYGSHVPTSLGMGVVVDTGGFASSNPRQLDIAVAW